MTLAIVFLALTFVSSVLSSDAYHRIAKRDAWQNDGNIQWALNCEFWGNDFMIVTTTGDKCGDACLSESQCTHYTWQMNNGGTCYLQKGPVSQDQSHYSQYGASCGIKI